MQAGGGSGDEETGFESRRVLNWEDGNAGDFFVMRELNTGYWY